MTITDFAAPVAVTEHGADVAYGVDLITFYHPSFWGVDTYEDIVALRQRDPLAIWMRIFDALQESGVEQIEMTFPPADWTSAIDAFGSAAGFKRALDERGLSLISGFWVGLHREDGASLDEIVAEAEAYAQFIREAGGDVLVVGPPMRRTWDAEEPLFIDGPYATKLAEVLHRVGAATLKHGVKTAVHTEAHSVFCTPRDIDLLLTLTDPTYVFFCPDTAHITLAGGDPVEVVSRHLDRVVISHWKDASGPQSRYIPIDENVHLSHRELMTTLGAGAVDWDAWIALYAKTRVANVRLLELDAVPDPVSEMIAARTFIESRTATAAPAPTA